MKVLITYFSMSGNTEQIAKAMFDEASKSHEATICKLDEINSNSFKDSDLVFIGSPIHAGGLAGPIKELLELLDDSALYKVAGFVTHSASAYEKVSFEKGIASIKEICESKKIAYIESFDCQGRLAPELHDMVQKKRNLSDTEWAERMAKSDPHPNSEDEADAKAFVKRVMELV